MLYDMCCMLVACILKPNLLLFQKNTKIIKFCSSNQCPLNLLRNIGSWSPGVGFRTEHFENWDAIVHCITQRFVCKTTAVVLKTANGNLGNRTGFTLYLTLSSINIQGRQQKNFQGEGAQWKKEDWKIAPLMYKNPGGHGLPLLYQYHVSLSS